GTSQDDAGEAQRAAGALHGDTLHDDTHLARTLPTGTHPAGTLYTVATAHLDTQWLWTIQDTIRDYVPSTLRDNFARFEKYPDYVFNFEGAFRYMLAKEYY